MDNLQWKWEGLYEQAFLETDALNLPARITDAERAIAARTTFRHSQPKIPPS